MPIQRPTQTINITSGGGTVNLSVADNFDYYHIVATGVTLTSSWTIQPSGTAEEFMLYQFKFKGALILDGNTFTVFGEDIDEDLLKNDAEIDCYYNGTSWEVTVKPSFLDSQFIVEGNIKDDAITTSKIAPLNVTAAEIADAAVTPTKQSANANYDYRDVQLSWKTGEIGAFYKHYFINPAVAVRLQVTVLELIEATDDATVTVSSNLGVMTGTVTLTAGATPGTVFSANLTGGNTVIAADSTVTYTTAKTTAGGRANASLVFRKT